MICIAEEIFVGGRGERELELELKMPLLLLLLLVVGIAIFCPIYPGHVVVVKEPGILCVGLCTLLLPPSPPR